MIAGYGRASGRDGVGLIRESGFISNPGFQKCFIAQEESGCRRCDNSQGQQRQDNGKKDSAYDGLDYIEFFLACAGDINS